MTCDKCKHWNATFSGESETGTCRRHAPTPLNFNTVNAYLYGKDAPANLTVEDTECCWPSTTADDWCGEFEGKT